MLIHVPSVANDATQAENAPHYDNGATPEESRPTPREEPQRNSTSSDLNSPLPQPLDRSLSMTQFLDKRAYTKREGQSSLREAVPHFEAMAAKSKDRLSLIKLGLFGDERSEKNCLRHNKNTLLISGIEADHDSGSIRFDEAEALLRKADLAALIYTSPSHREDNHRWRALCPLSRDMHPREREHYVARLNGVFHGSLDPCSFVISQAYYVGSVAGAATMQTRLIDGRFIDLADELDLGAIYRPATASASNVRRADVQATGFVTARALKALDTVCQRVAAAGFGSQEDALAKAGYAAGCLIAEGKLDAGYAKAKLVNAAMLMASEPNKRPWTVREIEWRVSRKIAQIAGAAA